ncbi:hypothetical protein [Jiella sp. M17.18]|uniref:hypothetical protein n=1 Tax=Jiella sp. M17.18 TaxID=3234247 RepID=UPI0034DFB049
MAATGLQPKSAAGERESLADLLPVILDRRNRASTIFPIFVRADTDCCLSFLSYWAWKHGTRVIIQLTLRRSDGFELGVRSFPVSDVRAHDLDIGAIFEIDSFGLPEGFSAALEVEVFSERAPLYTYPAMTLFYRSKNGLSAVHSCARTYNAGEKVADYAIGVPQTGFDVVFAEETANYVAFPLGHAGRYNLTLHLDRADGRVFTAALPPAQGGYGALNVILIEELFDAEATAPGLAKIRIAHDLRDVYPRFYCGQVSRDAVPTLTHSFFDTSDRILAELDVAEEAVTAQNRSSGDLFDGAFAIPLIDPADYRTELVSYGSNKSFDGEIVVRLYGPEGRLLASRTMASRRGGDGRHAAPLQGHQFLDVARLFDAELLEGGNAASVFFGFRTPDSSFPKRFKLGLNIRNKASALGTNICFAPHVLGPKTLEKPFNRRWMPVGGPQAILAWFSNTSLALAPDTADRTVRITVIDAAGERLGREVALRPNGWLALDPRKDAELADFLGGETGWATIEAQSYMSDAFYVSTAGTLIGGDHAF